MRLIFHKKDIYPGRLIEGTRMVQEGTQQAEWTTMEASPSSRKNYERSIEQLSWEKFARSSVYVHPLL